MPLPRISIAFQDKPSPPRDCKAGVDRFAIAVEQDRFAIALV
jgi:hypothetical protein